MTTIYTARTGARKAAVIAAAWPVTDNGYGTITVDAEAYAILAALPESADIFIDSERGRVWIGGDSYALHLPGEQEYSVHFIKRTAAGLVNAGTWTVTAANHADAIAAATLKAVFEHGFAVPGDTLEVGYVASDGHDFSEHVDLRDRAVEATVNQRAGGVT